MIDANGAFLTGVTIVVGATEDPNGDNFTLTIAEIGGGLYKVEFLASLVGSYYYRVDSVGITPIQSFEETFTIGPVTLYGAALGTAAYGNTLNDLIKRVATRMGDFLKVVATTGGAGDGTSFPDSLRLSAIPSSSLKGSSLTIVSPTNSLNYLQETRVADSSEGGKVLTLSPAFPYPVLTGNEGWLTNLMSRGFWRNQYIDAINEVVASSHPMHLVPVSYTYPESFSEDDPSIPAPLHLTHVYGVQYYDSEGWEIDIPYSDQNLRTIPGWSIDAASATVLISGGFRSVMNGMSVRLMGYGRPAELTLPGDFTTLPAAYIVPAAAAILRQAKGDQKQLSSASMLDNRADSFLVTAITQVQPGTIRVR